MAESYNRCSRIFNLIGGERSDLLGQQLVLFEDENKLFKENIVSTLR